MANYRGVKLWETTCSWHGNHADLWLLKICYNTVERLHSTYNFHSVLTPHKVLLWNTAREAKKGRTSLSEHGERKLKECTILTNRWSHVHWFIDNKNYLFPCLACFRSKMNPVYRKRRRNADRKGSSVPSAFALSKVRSADGAVTLQKNLRKSFSLSLLSK